MNEQSRPSVGRHLVPTSQIKGIIDALTQVARRLEELALVIEYAPNPADTVESRTDLGKRIEQALVANVSVGTESFPAADIADAVAAELELRGEPVSVTQIRRMLPPLMLRLFDSKLSCSVKTPEGRYARGYRGLTARVVPMAESSRR